MELYQLECFRVLCKHGNFTTASDELMVTQPAVSMAVKKLEEEFGATLLNRLDRGFTLTQAGENVLRRAIAIHNETNALRQELGGTIFKNPEVIRVGIPGTMDPGLMPRIVGEFAPQHIDISLTLLQRGHAAIAEGLANQTMDVGVLSCDMLSTLMVFRPCGRVEIFAAFSPDHRFAAFDRVTPELLAQENLLFSKTPNRIPGYIRRYFAEAGIKPAGCTYHNIFPDGCAQLARRGLGIALVPRHVAEPSCVPLDPPLYCDLAVAWNKKNPPTREMQLLIDFLAPEE